MPGHPYVFRLLFSPESSSGLLVVSHMHLSFFIVGHGAFEGGDVGGHAGDVRLDTLLVGGVRVVVFWIGIGVVVGVAVEGVVCAFGHGFDIVRSCWRGRQRV